jgi:hypothetical protein
MEDWESNQVSEISDYKYQQALRQSAAVNNEEATFQNETWVRDPPNVLFYSLARVQYDKAQNKAVKTLKKYTFEKKIYID